MLFRSNNPGCMFYYGDLLIKNGKSDEGIVWKEKAIDAGFEPNYFEKGVCTKPSSTKSDAQDVLNHIQKLEESPNEIDFP